MGRLKIFYVIFDDNQSVFHPGEMVTGRCLVDLEADMKVHSIQISMRGIAEVHWSERTSVRNQQGSNTKHYTADIEYFLQRQVPFGSESGVTEHTIKKGHHEFPFSFQLPYGGIASSFEGEFGSIRYWVKAEMHKPQSNSKNVNNKGPWPWSINPKIKKPFTVITPVNIDKNEYLIPVGGQTAKSLSCWLCASAPISIYATTDRKGYSPGESIKITADFENLSNRVVVPKAALYQTLTFVATDKRRCEKSKLSFIKGSAAIQPGREMVWDSQLLQVPAAVSPSITNCSLIKVEYSVRVKLKIPAAFNLSIDLPVVIGAEP